MAAPNEEPVPPVSQTFTGRVSTVPFLPTCRSRSRRSTFPQTVQIASEHDTEVQSELPSTQRPFAAAETVFSALQYLPVPVMVLSSSKTIILANEAMKGLLVPVNTEVGAIRQYRIPAETGAEKSLLGQSLSQIGVYMVPEEDQVSASLEALLDDLLKRLCPNVEDEEEDKTQDILSITGHGIHTGAVSEFSKSAESWSDPPREPLTAPKGQTLVHDISVNIFIKSGYLDPRNLAFLQAAANSKPKSSIAMRMMISVWKLDNDPYITLTFPSTPWDTPSTTQTRSRIVCEKPSLAALASVFEATDEPVSEPRNHSRPPLSRPSSAFSQDGSYSLALESSISEESGRSDRTAQYKLLRMKDAIIDAIEIPIATMWKDGTLAVANRAASRLMHEDPDTISAEGEEFLSRFKVYTEDFERELEQHEYPLVMLCRDQNSFKKFRVGIMDYNHAKRVFEVTGDGIYDERNGEFLAGIVALKDVTWYMDLVKEQSERDERKFQLICETMPQIVWTSAPDGKPDYMSPKWYEFSGLMAKTPSVDCWLRAVHPDDQSDALKRWDESLAMGKEHMHQYRARRYDGEWRWMQGRALPLRDKTCRIMKWFGTITDIHDLVEARLSAKRIQEHLLNVIIHASVTVWTVDNELNLTLLEGKLMWEDEPPEFMQQVLGQNVFHVFGKHQKKKDWELFKGLIEAILKGEVKEWTNEHQLIEGKGRWYRTRLAPIRGVKRVNGVIVPNEEGNIEGLMGCSVDVTEIKERDQALQSQEKENLRLSLAEQAAKETSKQKGQFLANMSHEIRTPIAGVIGMTEILLDTDLNNEQRECAETIHRSANGLLTIINDVLDFSKVESGKLDLEEIPFSITLVVKDVCKMLSFAAKRKLIDFKNEIHTGIEQDLVLMGDPGRVRQILTNLLNNSIKFTSKGYVKLAVRRDESNSETIKIFFTVEDTGIGIPQEAQKKLFKPFSQADSSTARRYGGTGLGLTICKNLVDLMHGGMSLESELGRGTKTTFWIPFHRPHLRDAVKSDLDLRTNSSSLDAEPSMGEYQFSQQNVSSDLPEASSVARKESLAGSVPGADWSPDRVKTPQPPAEKTSSWPQMDRNKIHVLVVEDNAVNQTIALKLIRKFGFSATAVWNGKEALEYLLASDRPKPDIVLMDVQMPILDGYRATHFIRHHKPFSTLAHIRTLPIVAMTASAIQGDKEKCVRAGMDDYLAKPVKSKTLEDMLLKWAFEGKQKERLLEFPSTHESDHDSNCDFPPSGPASTASESVTSLDDRERVAPTAVESCDAGMHGATRRGLPRDDSAEQAIILRDEQLLVASEPNPYQLHISVPSPNPYLQPAVPSTPLTTENMLRHDREREINPFEFTFSCASEDGYGESLATAAPSREPSPQESQSDSETIKMVRADSLRVLLGGRMARNESSDSFSSQATIKEL